MRQVQASSLMLYNQYREEHYYWEAVRLLEHLPYIGIVTFTWNIPDLRRALLLLAVAVVSNVVLMVVNPFRFEIIRNVEMMAGISTLSLLLLLIILEHTDVTGNLRLALKGMILAVLLLDIGTYVVLMLHVARQDLAKVHRTMKSLMPGLPSSNLFSRQRSLTSSGGRKQSLPKLKIRTLPSLTPEQQLSSP